MIRKNLQLLVSLQKLIDVAILVISIILAFIIRFFNYEGTYLELKFYITGAIIIAPIYLWVCTICKLYKPYRTGTMLSEFFRIVYSTLLITVVALTILFVLKIVDVSRLVIVLFVIINIFLLSFFRLSLRGLLRKFRAKGYNIKYILSIFCDLEISYYLVM